MQRVVQTAGQAAERRSLDTRPVSAHARWRVSPVMACVAWAALLTGCLEPPRSGAFEEGPRTPARPPAPASLTITAAELPAEQLRLGLAPIVAPADMVAQHRNLAVWLEEALGVPVVLVVADSYLDLIDRLLAHTVDLAILPPATFALARDRSPAIRLLASQIAGGATSYSSYIIVRRDAPFEGLQDLRGKRVSLVDEASASGFILPWATFLDHGLDPRRDFASVRFAGNHASAIADVLAGRADAAATYSGMLDYTRRTAGATAEAADLRILHKAGRIPYDALCAAPGLSAHLDAHITAAFMAMDTRSARGRHIYAGTSNHVSGWAPPSEQHYDGIRATMARVAAHRGQTDGVSDAAR